MSAPSKRLTRAVYGAFIALTAAFVVSSVAQVARTLFGGAAGGAPPPIGTDCAQGVRGLALAVEQARAAAASAPNLIEAERRYEATKRPAWERHEAVARACQADPAGPDALSAVVRLDRATQGALRREASQLAPVRREVDSFIR